MTDAAHNRLRPDSVLFGLAATCAVVLVPDLVRFGLPFWTQPHAAQAPLLGLGFLAALWVGRLGRRTPLLRAAFGLATLAVAGATVFMVSKLVPAIPLVRSAALLSLGMSAVLVLLGEFGSNRPLVLRLGSVLLVLSSGALLWRSATAPAPIPPPRILFSIYQPLQLLNHGRQVADEDVHRGGSFAVAGTQVLVMTGSGAIYHLKWDGNAMESERLPLPPPVDFSRFDPSLVTPPHPEMVRATDMVVKADDNGWRFFVSHHEWHEERCVTMAVSTATLDSALERVTEPWRVVASSKPCLPFGDSILGGNFAGHLSGGQLAFYSDTELLWTLGDHGLDMVGRPTAAAQLDSHDYGKTVRVDITTGTVTPFSKGQRNPQGLFIAPDGRIWATEHGPRGGDELNLVLEGRNYGWPYATFGTDYGQLVWPPAEGAVSTEEFTLPRYSWLPSVATSAVIGIQSPLFPRWAGNLMVASLAGRALHRIALDGDRVVYTERIQIGEEVRDLIEGPDGALWLWNDGGVVMTLRPAPASERGAIVVAACTGCHTVSPDQPPTGRGPTLAGVVNRPVASEASFSSYSPALRSLGGQWTPQRLEHFLADPAAFAPGTTMNYRVVTKEDREALIAFLATIQ